MNSLHHLLGAVPGQMKGGGLLFQSAMVILGSLEERRLSLSGLLSEP